MTALKSGGWTDDPQAMARRTLGIEAVSAGALGLTAVALGGTLGPEVGLRPTVVRLAGLVSMGWSATTGLWSLGEDWKTPTRRSVAANGLASAALAGHALVRGTSRGRAGVALVAMLAGGAAITQGKTLVAAEPDVLRPGRSRGAGR